MNFASQSKALIMQHGKQKQGLIGLNKTSETMDMY